MKITLVSFFTLACVAVGLAVEVPIDREALVRRHNPVIRKVDPDAPLTVGNGGFAFGCDITGLQTFADFYQRNGIPVEILSRWCWVIDPNPQGFSLADANRDFALPDGCIMGFPTRSSTPAGDWLRKNPRNHPLGQLALEWDKSDGTALGPEDIQEPEQTLDLWTGIVTSRFKLGGVPVVVTTACHPRLDVVAVRIESELVKQGKLHVRLDFPRGHDLAVKNTPALDWSRPEEHVTEWDGGNWITRQVRTTRYGVKVGSFAAQGSFVRVTRRGSHEFRLSLEDSGDRMDFAVGFYRDEEPPAIFAVSEMQFAESAAHWERFWRSGATVDFSGSTNPLAAKIEERIVLSQYLMAVQMAGDVPPQESRTHLQHLVRKAPHRDDLVACGAFCAVGT